MNIVDTSDDKIVIGVLFLDGKKFENIVSPPPPHYLYAFGCNFRVFYRRCDYRSVCLSKSIEGGQTVLLWWCVFVQSVFTFSFNVIRLIRICLIKYLFNRIFTRFVTSFRSW